MSGKQVRAQYTREFKLEAVRQVRAGKTIAMVAKLLGIPKASLGNSGCGWRPRESWTALAMMTR